MNRPAHLLDHEAVCPECHGEGRIECSGIHPRRLGGVSVMETPDTWTERCETCGGTGDRRERERTAIDRVWDEDERVANLAMNRGQTINRMQDEIDRLVAENRELRARVTGVGVTYARVAS